MHSSNSPVSALYILVMNLGYHQNYYDLAQQQKDELEALFWVLPRTGLPDHIYFKQPCHSNYPIDRRDPGSRRAHSYCSGTMNLFPLLGNIILSKEKLRWSWTRIL